MAVNKYLDEFMAHYRYTALTYDDVSLVTDYADFLPTEADTQSLLSRRIKVNVPFISAAMDTVTEDRMAIAMAMIGGIGIIHKNLDIDRQAMLVRRVKSHLNGLITEPVTFRIGQTLRYIRETRLAKNYSFSGFPILDDSDNVVGILTARDIKFAKNDNIPAAEVMTRPVITAAKTTTLLEAYEIMQKRRIGKLPLVDEQGRLVGLYSFSDVTTLIKNMQPMYNRDQSHRLRVGAAVSPNDHQRIEALIHEGADVIVVDTAHGHSSGVINMTRWIKEHYPETDVIAGNIATGEAAIALRDAGADAVKVGIGPGSICTTRVVAGVGVPQIRAIYDCAKALDNTIPVIADGGIRHSGDVAKAIAAGAHTAMMGSILAGTEQSPGEKIIYQGRQYVAYRGMGSLDAMKSRQGSRERYGQADVAEENLVPQGIDGIVPFAGSVDKVMKQYVGGLAAALGYCGCRNIEELRQRARFVQVTNAGVAEAHPHDIVITKEAPNYRCRG